MSAIMHLNTADLSTSLFQYHPDAVFLLDTQGKVVDSNSAAEKMAGWTRQEMLTMPDIAHLIGKNQLQVENYFRSALRGATESFETLLQHPKGHLVPVSVTLVPAVFNSLVCGCYALVKDITELHRGRQRHYEIEQLYRLVWENSQDMIYLCTHDGIYRYVSLSVEKMLGYRPDEFVGKRNTDFHHPKDLAFTPTITDTDTDLFTYRVRHKNGHFIWVETKIQKICDDDGTVQFVVGLVRDVTRHKQVEQLLQESDQRYQSLLNNNPDGICSVDLNGRFTEVNPAYERITGYVQEELFQMTYRDLMIPDEMDRTAGLFQESLTIELSDIHLKLKHKSGHLIDVLAKSVPIIINQESVGVYIISKDITEQKQTEELLRKSEKLSAVGQLAAGVAHEIKNPLTALKGFTQLLQSSLTNAKKSYFDIMISELNRIESIVNEMLVLAKPQAINFKLKDPALILLDVIRLLDTQAILNNIQIMTDFQTPVPFIQCEENQLKQVFVNLIKNAIEAMPTGGFLDIQLKVANQELVVRFIDHGGGIPAESIPKLGEPFYSTKEKGTGLGLMVSHKIIENHKGKIYISSELGVGTTIDVCLPVYFDEEGHQG